MRRSPALAAVARYRWSVAGRVLAASVGGYALTSTGCSVLAQLLVYGAGVAPAVAVLSATLLSFVVYTVVALWMFRARDALHMWRWSGAWLAMLAGADWLLRSASWTG
ncbi:hypothetical protein NC00_02730 [Xanthomonas cannabis pv. phaseoli]|uniref:DUF3649 domain-containing protein n=1 Tax=Xanthomonas cannabis pv. phaseoli TaxID=1885902 RepID=A0AB34PC68_9XANT|nr:hypothetical protein [Xanthomonas cannabis]KGK59264.1 hypothetical protein NC00_02730 [Xanthomonas cannabis pv. phaseoli]